MNNYKTRYSPENEEPKIVQLLPVPMAVTAVFDNGDGTEYRESVFLIALYSDGDVSYLTADPDGIFDRPDEISNFLTYEFSENGA